MSAATDAVRKLWSAADTAASDAEAAAREAAEQAGKLRAAAEAHWASYRAAKAADDETAPTGEGPDFNEGD